MALDARMVEVIDYRITNSSHPWFVHPILFNFNLLVRHGGSFASSC